MSEINLLKTQVDHHFLFNTLNNIYSLSVTEPNQTRKMIKKLWGLLDYMVNVSKYKLIDLTRELGLIADYIEIERLRYGDRLIFNYKADKTLDRFKVPPLLLFPFIENCFRHGSALDPGNPWIRVEIKDMGDRFSFIAANSRQVDKKQNYPEHSQIKLTQNVRKILDYYFPERYMIRIHENPKEFSVELDVLF